MFYLWTKALSSIHLLGGRRAGADLGPVVCVRTVKTLAQEYTEKSKAKNMTFEFLPHTETSKNVIAPCQKD